ncbi:hypothetical protein CA13_02570 [Planctomycetes bacterium CA13]|uniref:Uncharacterized protein n=1 Tax=Novipirellula herctigrandis TaxID=2527986 RepID=A0A5C5YVJ4_9BACT|nr:hypothetical protein CA13_02570 [Planctomycetes bacterium CA13]
MQKYRVKWTNRIDEVAIGGGSMIRLQNNDYAITVISLTVNSSTAPSVAAM